VLVRRVRTADELLSQGLRRATGIDDLDRIDLDTRRLDVGGQNGTFGIARRRNPMHEASGSVYVHYADAGRNGLAVRLHPFSDLTVAGGNGLRSKHDATLVTKRYAAPNSC